MYLRFPLYVKKVESLLRDVSVDDVNIFSAVSHLFLSMLAGVYAPDILI